MGARGGTTVASKAVDTHLERAWEMARQLPEFQKYELIDFIEFLTEKVEDEEAWEPDEEEMKQLRAFFAGEEEPGTPLEDVERKSEELGESVLD
jgi:hypothetical protein